MEKLIKAGRLFYGIAMVAFGIQQFLYADFRPILFPVWRIPWLPFWAWLCGAAFVGAGAAIIFEKKGRTASLLLGGLLFLLIIFGHLPYELFIDPNSIRHLGLWANAFEGLALSGGAFVVAGSFPEENGNAVRKPFIIKLLEGMIPIGSIFFSIAMISLGIGHFLYTEYVAALVPAWFPDHIFWTYFAGVALIGAGVSIILGVKLKKIGILLGSMLFLWVVLLHIPRAIADPFENEANEITSVFAALAFSGTAFLITSVREEKVFL